MDEYQAFYESRFVQNLARYSNLRQRIQRRSARELDGYPNFSPLPRGSERGAPLKQCRLGRAV